MCCVFSSPIGRQVIPPSVDLYMPQPGSMELREFGSPVPRYTVCVSDGAMAIAPVEAQGYVSKVGRNVIPPLVVFQTPPAAAETKKVADPGIPSMSVTRPSKFAGPTVRQRSALSVNESSVWAEAEPPTMSAPTTAETKWRCIRSKKGVGWPPSGLGRRRSQIDITSTLALERVLAIMKGSCTAHAS